MKLAVGAMGGTPSLSSSSSDRAFEYCSCSIMLYSSFVSTCTPSQVGEDHDDDDHGRQAEDDDDGRQEDDVI